jgi:hypothetical protein
MFAATGAQAYVGPGFGKREIGGTGSGTGVNSRCRR